MALYHPFTESIAAMICGLPAKIVVAISFNLVLYFMTFATYTGKFLHFLALLVCVHPYNVDDIPYYWSSLPNNRPGHGSCFDYHDGSHHIHWLHDPYYRHASVVQMD
ncbi:hypothetical protein BT96DRAFT_659907 [Gymnopus androsaceus JB14]|uniref:Uncharacterized protein n=1 Tax=Gymnopus androsaceus JB14 TaxID=1447944 RepID=A0A6A4GFI0_9AGAR|nr:hypothetical protein BT96DRAFT_659907 [Gymnopus androsaceus JB14]